VRLKLPDPSSRRAYEHRRPQRPSHLPRRLTPPPERAAPPDLTLFLYAGLALLIVLVIAAIPMAVRFLLSLFAA
jgi:hypothetical protein